MKIRNIYIKLFVLLLLIITALQVYFFIDLNFLEEGQVHPERNKNRVMKIQVLKELVEEDVRLNKGFDQAKESLQDIISRTARLYEAKIWIEDSNGVPVLESYLPEDRPAKVTANYNIKTRMGDVSIFHYFSQKRKYIFTDIPLDSRIGNGLSLHILYEGELGDYRSRFLMGLAGIIVIMAVLALSVLQVIRIKISRFRKSVLRIAEGELSHRVEVDGHGVVEDLGRAFNNMTEKLEKMISSSKEITANVSHEIRTPLTRIRIVEDLLRKKLERVDFSDFGRHLDSIREDIQILDDLTGRLLEFVKLDRYELISKDEQFDPSELMHSLVIRFEPVIESKDLKIKNELSFAGKIQGDRKSLTSAFLNILDNAFKYTSEHGEIIIRTGSGQDFFEASITNSFEKIDEKDLENIFKPFERARRSDSAGSGLGLAITKKIVEKHGGSIVALNSDNGFEIQVRLPL
jgi:two-component system, OmpR family, sensor histidine kinase CpxA